MDWKKIAVLGDSITFGADANPPEEGFVGLLAKQSRARVVNLGICGTRIARKRVPSEVAMFDQDFCGRFLEIPRDTEVILVFGGTNDYGHGDAPLGDAGDHTPDTFRGACAYLLDGLREHYPKAVIAVLTPLHRTGEETAAWPGGGVLEDYVRILREETHRRGMPLLDLYADSRLRFSDPENCAKFSPDGLHPNNEGHRVLAEEVAAFLQGLQPA